jgi:hypothetical protein
MSLGLLAAWRRERERRRLAERFVERAGTERVDPSDVAWLELHGATATTARRELQLLQRAVTQLVAERDALDDRTAADVAHVLAARAIGAGSELSQAWPERWRAYSGAASLRGQPDAPAVRLARVFLLSCDVAPDLALPEATRRLQDFRTRANAALRETFGEVSLPEDVRPSALR